MKHLYALLVLFLLQKSSVMLGQTLDLTFGTQGITTTFQGNTDFYVTTSAVYPDGRILVAGESQAGGFDEGFVARYRANGTLDPSFGSGGIVTFFGNNWPVISVAILPKKKILAMIPSSSSAFIYKFDSTGMTDGSFGINGQGYVTISYTNTFSPENIDLLNVMKVQSDGKILIGGKTTISGFFVARLLANGTRDNSFLYSSVETPGGSEVKDLLIRPNGEILAVGSTRLTTGSEELMIVRKFDSNGGFAFYYLEGSADKIIEDVYGNFMLLGSYINASSTSGQTQTDIRVMRLKTNGYPDNDFGNMSSVTISTSNVAQTRDYPTGIISLQESKYIIVGSASVASGLPGTAGPFLAKLNFNGSKDLTFGNQGFQTNILGTGETYALSHCSLSDERIVAAGIKRVNNFGGIAVSRWLPKCTRFKTLSPIVCGTDTWYFLNEEFTTAGTYTRKFIGTTCDTVYTINLQILPIVSPSVSIVSNPSSTTCAGSQVTFSVGASQHGGTNPAWIWRRNSNVVSNSSTYSSTNLITGDQINLEMQSSRACLSSFPPSPVAYSNTITMTVNPLPVINTSINGNTINCSPITGAQYQWLNCNSGNVPIVGATNPDFSPTQNGSYAIRVTISNCTKTSACLPFVLTSVNEAIAKEEITLSPNPASNFISLAGFSGKSEYQILDGIGRCVGYGLIEGDQSQIAISTLQQGIYILKIEGKEVQRFLKE